jgi:polyisoprenoid-binding protein YceI
MALIINKLMYIWINYSKTDTYHFLAFSSVRHLSQTLDSNSKINIYMSRVTKRLSLLALAIGFAGSTLLAQSHQISNANFEVAGTSTLHDWTMETDQVNGTINMNIEGDKISTIDRFDIKLKAESLESGKSSMDDIAYEALKSEDHPMISFKLTKIKSITYSGTTAKIVANGILTIAGKSKTVDVNGTAVNNNGAIQLNGSKKIKMTDFDMEPPTAMFGTIKTGDSLTINYSLTLKTK